MLYLGALLVSCDSARCVRRSHIIRLQICIFDVKYACNRLSACNRFVFRIKALIISCVISVWNILMMEFFMILCVYQEKMPPRKVMRNQGEGSAAPPPPPPPRNPGQEALYGGVKIAMRVIKENDEKNKLL